MTSASDETTTTSYQPKSVLITGGCGFIGSNFINYMFDKWPSTTFVNIDKLICGADPTNVDEHIRHSNNYHLVIGSIQDRDMLLNVLNEHKVDTVIHFAAITHVDDSYRDRIGTITENVTATTILLEVVCHDYCKMRRFVHISTDEIYGDSIDDAQPKSEISPPNPTNPYAASKAACESIINAYWHSYKLPFVMVRMNNVFGPRQADTKLIPKFIKLAANSLPYPLMGDGRYSRSWIYVDDCSEAIRRITEGGRFGQIYNIGTEFELENIDLTRMIHEKTAKQLKHDVIEIKYQPIADRPYHDRRYLIDFRKISTELGWSCKVSFDDGLTKTIEYYLKKI